MSVRDATDHSDEVSDVWTDQMRPGDIDQDLHSSSLGAGKGSWSAKLKCIGSVLVDDQPPHVSRLTRVSVCVSATTVQSFAFIKTPTDLTLISRKRSAYMCGELCISSREQQIAFKNLVQRNQANEVSSQSTPPPGSVIQLPFIILNTDVRTVIDCSISSDKYEISSSVETSSTGRKSGFVLFLFNVFFIKRFI